MGDPKLKIAPKRYGGESMVISMRLSREMLQEIDGAARATGRTRNENYEYGSGICAGSYGGIQRGRAGGRKISRRRSRTNDGYQV